MHTLFLIEKKDRSTSSISTEGPVPLEVISEYKDKRIFLLQLSIKFIRDHNGGCMLKGNFCFGQFRVILGIFFGGSYEENHKVSDFPAWLFFSPLIILCTLLDFTKHLTQSLLLCNF